MAEGRPQLAGVVENSTSFTVIGVFSESPLVGIQWRSRVAKLRRGGRLGFPLSSVTAADLLLLPSPSLPVMGRRRERWTATTDGAKAWNN